MTQLKPGKYSLSVATRLQDNGDGGYTLYAYNDTDELLAGHPKATEFKKVNGKYQDVPVELTQEQKDAILNEEDAYENGYIGSDTIELEVTADGKIRLAKPIHFHAGQ